MHMPTGISVRCEGERSQHHNRRLAMELLRARLHSAQASSAKSARAAARRAQVGSGQRGDKRRTVRLQADQVVDHVTGITMRAKSYLRGELGAISKAMPAKE